MRFGRARRSVTAAAVGFAVLAGITACRPQAEAPDTPLTRVRAWTVEITDYAPR